MRLVVIWLIIGMFTAGFTASSSQVFRDGLNGDDGMALLAGAIVAWPLFAGRLIGDALQ